jgi:hypothetical protein
MIQLTVRASPDRWPRFKAESVRLSVRRRIWRKLDY